MVAIGALVLTACSPLDQAAHTLDQATGMPVIVIAPCENERVAGIQIALIDTDSGHAQDTPLWRATSSRPSRLTRIVAGEVPAGFVEDVGPLDSVPNGPMSFTVEMDGGTAIRHGGYVDVGELEPNVLVQSGREVAYDDLRRDARINCSRFPPWQAWPHWVVIGGLIAIGVASTAGFVSIVRRCDRRKVRSGSDPPAATSAT